MANISFDDRRFAASESRRPGLVARLLALFAARQPETIDRETANRLLGLNYDLLHRAGYFWTVERPRNPRF